MDPKKNRIGLEITPYRGGKTTLCAGCGHNAISERVIDAFFEMGIHPRDVLKLSGIGCSSKTPAYFLGEAHGFKSVPDRLSRGAVLPVGSVRRVAERVHAELEVLPEFRVHDRRTCWQ